MTNSTQLVVAALAEFRLKPKFRCTEPQFKLLNPSPASVTAPLTSALNECATQLSHLVQSGAPTAALKNAIQSSLHSVETPVDTEDREYLAHYYYELGNIVGVKTGPLLNSWLYGPVLGLLLRVFGRA